MPGVTSWRYAPIAETSRTRTAVIVLHGFSGHRLPELAAFVPWLQERHHVLQFDFRGHGDSDPAENGDYSIAGLVQDVEATADQLGLRA